MIKLFIDTEFTTLDPGNKLISIALVSENSDHFYAELTDTYKRKDCSDFVLNFVLPFLKGNKEYQMTEAECALKMTNWIENHDCEFILACDNISWDLPHLKKLIDLTTVWPDNLSKDEYFKFGVIKDAAERIVLENNFDIHNALDDANAMMLAYKEGCIREYR